MYRLCPNMVQITVLFLSRSFVTRRHRSVIMNKVVDESLRKICHYQQNMPQHYYLLDTLVFNKVLFHFLFKETRTKKMVSYVNRWNFVPMGLEILH